MAKGKASPDPNVEIRDLLRRLLILGLYERGAPQASIAKKLKMNLNLVNEFLKGVRRNGDGGKGGK